MLPQTFANENKEDNDIIFFRKIAEKINDNRILLTADCYSSDIQQTLISKASFLVGARYHSIVFAINQNIPFISLSYEHKMTGLLQCLDLTEYEIDIQNIFKEKQNILNLFYTKIKTNIVKPNVQEKAQSIAYECTNKLLNIMK
jgi:colanic acid/amylovoran biosynthesis protein